MTLHIRTNDAMFRKFHEIRDVLLQLKNTVLNCAINFFVPVLPKNNDKADFTLRHLTEHLH